MAIDPTIALRVNPVQIENPLDAYAKVAQFKQMQQQNRLAELALGEKQREVAADNALAGLLASGKTGNDVAAGLAGQGFGAKSLAYAKQAAELARQQREAEKERLAAAKQQIELIGQVAGAANDPQSYAQGRALLAQSGIDVSSIPEQYDPQYVTQARAQAMSAAQQLEQVWKQKGYDLDVAKFAYQQQNDAQNRAVTIRGQNMTDARGREANDINRQLVGQERQLKIEKLQAEKDDREKSKKAAIAKAEESIAVIDKALKHPGREIATGKSGVLDPRNYMAGTDAMDFQIVLDQLGGQAFLQAFESLKGGGQITEVEGKKATDAMARLNRKQSDTEFKRSLQDLREVVEAGLRRAKGGAGGATPVPDAAPSPNIDALLKKYGG